MELTDLVQDPPLLSPKRALVLIEQLPIEYRTPALIRGVEEGVGWDTQTYLLAAAVDAIRENTHVNIQVRSKKKMKPPERIQAPGLTKRRATKPPNRFVRMAQQQLQRSQ